MASALLAGCSGGGGCGEPDSDADPRSLLPKEGGGFERLAASSDSLQDEGEARIRGSYSDSDSEYSATIFRFAGEQGAEEFEDYLLRAVEINNDSAYVLLTLGNFVFIGMSRGGSSPEETQTRVRELLARSPVLSTGCVSEHNALSAEQLPGSGS